MRALPILALALACLCPLVPTMADPKVEEAKPSTLSIEFKGGTQIGRAHV